MMRRTIRLLLILVAGACAVAPGWAEYGDILFERQAPVAEGDYPPATFPHYVHRMQFKCNVCHDSIFAMKAGANAVNMDAIQSGKFCGQCHNNSKAFGVTFEACARCHRPL